MYMYIYSMLDVAQMLLGLVLSQRKIEFFGIHPSDSGDFGNIEGVGCIGQVL